MAFAFGPDAGRAAELDRRVRAGLAESLERAIAACDGFLTWRSEAVAALLRAIRGRPVRAGVFALYADFIEAIFGERLGEAQRVLDALLGFELVAPRRVLALDDGMLGGQAARYVRMIAEGRVHMPMPEADFTQGAARMAEALALLARGAPPLAAEAAVLLPEIVLARRGGEAGLTSVTSFYLWGAAFINFGEAKSRLALAESVAHEAAHMLLFGMSLGAPLVTNGAEARFASPLREDLRPMDGVVHAAFVVARLAWLSAALLESGALSDAEVVEARETLARSRLGFWDAHGVIERDARFSEVGGLVYAGAAAWMGRHYPRI